MRCKHKTAAWHDGSKSAPHDALGADVHAGGGFVEEEHGGVAHEGDGEGEFALVAAGELGGHAVLEELEADGADDLMDVVFDARDAADAGIEAEVFEYGHLIARVDLGAHAQRGSSCSAVFADGDVFDKDFAAVVRGSDVASDEADCGTFAGSIGAQKGKDFAAFDAKRNVLYGDVAAKSFCEVHHSKTVVGRDVDALDFGGDFIIRLVGFFDVFWLVGSAADLVPD